MPSAPVNEVLSASLRALMAQKKLSQKALSAKSGIAQTTISLYLRPGSRAASASGKRPSAKLGEVEMLAMGLGVQAWELLRPQGVDSMIPAVDEMSYSEGALLDMFRRVPRDGNMRSILLSKLMQQIADVLQETIQSPEPAPPAPPKTQRAKSRT